MPLPFCEAASRPHMNFVPPKTLAQQGMPSVHACAKASRKNARPA